VKAAHVGNGQLDGIEIFVVEMPAGVGEFSRGDAQGLNIRTVVLLRETSQSRVATLSNLPDDRLRSAADIGVVGDGRSLQQRTAFPAR
jgi:hypothetical protein